MLYAAPERWLEPSLYQNRAGWTKSNLKYKGIEDWCLAGVHFRHPQVLWVSTDPLDVRKDCQQGTMPQTICSLNMYLTTQPNFYKLGLRWLYNGNDDFCPRIYNLFGAEKTKRSWKKQQQLTNIQIIDNNSTNFDLFSQIPYQFWIVTYLFRKWPKNL